MTQHIPPQDPDDEILSMLSTFQSGDTVLHYRIDSRTDIFSLGCTLYEAATRRLPFDGNSILSTMDNIANLEPVTLSAIIPGLPAQFNEIVLRALAKDKDERYQSALEFASRLRELKASLGEEFQAPLKQRKQQESARKLSNPSAVLPPVFSAEHLVSKFKQHKIRALIAMLIVAAIFAATAIYLSRGNRSIRSLAVLPFANASANPKDEYLSEGVTENIINNLSQIPELRVLARTTVFRYEGILLTSKSRG